MKDRESRQLIQVISLGAVEHVSTRISYKCCNPDNLITIPTKKPIEASKHLYMPSFLLSNAMSLAPKIDEIRDTVHYANFDFICITETWFKDHIDNNVISISGYNVARPDRCKAEHGGVCIYIKDSIQFKVLEDLKNNQFEVPWSQLRPSRLPRGITSIVVGTLYHPPSAADTHMLDYLYDCLSIIEARFPGCGIILLGDPS